MKVTSVLAVGVLLFGALSSEAVASPAARPGAGSAHGAAASPSSAHSSQSGMIVFSSGFILNGPDTDNPSQVFSVRPDGSHVRQLTHVPADKQAGAPDLSTDGRRIAYVSDVDGNFAVWAMSADGSHQHRLFGRTNYDYFQPRWSPDGRRLVATQCDNTLGFTDQCTIILADSDGSHRRTLVGDHVFSGDASFSPDGEWIAFDSDRAGYQSVVWKVPSEGGRPIRLTKPSFEGFWPNWSPDGRHLVVNNNCCSPGNANVYTMRSDGSQLRRLTRGANAGLPSYSPDGSRIVFSSNQLSADPDLNDLFVMRADGTHQHRIVQGQPNAVGGDWEREK